MCSRIAVTTGEPAGIGPEILLQLCQQQTEAQLVAVADQQLLAQRAQSLNLPVTLQATPQHSRPAPAGTLYVHHIPMAAPSLPGQLDTNNAAYVLETLAVATDNCLTGDFDAMVTAPVHKAVINDAGVSFSGHTEFLAERTNTAKVVMMLATPSLRVALATTHLPLKDVSAAITQDELRQVITILDQDLRLHFGLEKPRIMVLGLNPHAGEGGHMGSEELDTIIPVIEQLPKINLSGPIPADTGFTPERLQDVDAVLAMYHDQGLPVLKYQGFGEAVNITLGLPIIRTSVDHGTALDLAGTGRANTGSLAAAINCAIEMAVHREQLRGQV